MIAKNYCRLRFTLSARECVRVSMVLQILSSSEKGGEGNMLRKDVTIWGLLTASQVSSSK